MNMGTGTGSRPWVRYHGTGTSTGMITTPWVRLWVWVQHNTKSWVWERVRDHGYGNGHGPKVCTGDWYGYYKSA